MHHSDLRESFNYIVLFVNMCIVLFWNKLLSPSRLLPEILYSPELVI